MPNTLDVRQKLGLNASRQSTSPASPGIGTLQTRHGRTSGDEAGDSPLPARAFLGACRHE